MSITYFHKSNWENAGIYERQWQYWNNFSPWKQESSHKSTSRLKVHYLIELCTIEDFEPPCFSQSHIELLSEQKSHQFQDAQRLYTKGIRKSTGWHGNRFTDGTVIFVHKPLFYAVDMIKVSTTQLAHFIISLIFFLYFGNQ